MRNPTTSRMTTLAFLLAVTAPVIGRAGTAPDAQPDPQAIEAIIDGLQAGQTAARQAAVQAAVELGEPIVPALLDLALSSSTRGPADAQQALRLMGKKARPALPRLLKLAAEKEPASSTDARNMRRSRQAALTMLKDMGWAAAEVTPVLRTIAGDAEENQSVRQAAILGLGGMGKEGLPVLRKLADAEPGTLREQARQALATSLQEQRIQTQAQYYAGLVEADRFDPQVPEYLRMAEPRSNYGPEQPLTTKVKAACRARLKEKPDAQVARVLAQIIQDQLSETTLEWSAPNGRIAMTSFREDPEENYTTLSEVLSAGFKLTEPDTQLGTELGVALARLRLLQGDWAGMRATLEKLGWSAPSAEALPRLSAPPAKWGPDLTEQWTVADDEICTGDCTLVVRVEMGGKGLRGAQVIVKPAEASTRPTASAFQTDALLPGTRTGRSAARSAALPAAASRLQTLRLAGLSGFTRGASFGYDAADRALTRYAVTDAQGQAKFEQLPEADVRLEVHVPTGDINVAGRGWELWIEAEPGCMKRAANIGGADTISPADPQALVELVSGRTVNYPRLVVVPLMELELEDWTQADEEQFELRWPAVKSPSNESVAYELEMSLSGPGQPSAYADSLPAIRTTRQIVDTNHWPVGAKGVGGQRLSPGNIYFFRVVARDARGEVLARALPKRVWTAWPERKSRPPYAGSAAAQQSPIRVETSNRKLTSVLAARTPKLAERVARYLKDNPEAFEREYAQVGAAWLAWSDGDEKAARRQIEDLVESLPAGSVPQATARWLLDALENGEEPPETLKLRAPRVIPVED